MPIAEPPIVGTKIDPRLPVVELVPLPGPPPDFFLSEAPFPGLVGGRGAGGAVVSVRGRQRHRGAADRLCRGGGAGLGA